MPSDDTDMACLPLLKLPQDLHLCKMSEETHFLKLKRVAAALPFVAAIRATCSLVRYSMSASVKLHRSNVNYNQRRLWADHVAVVLPAWRTCCERSNAGEEPLSTTLQIFIAMWVSPCRKTTVQLGQKGYPLVGPKMNVTFPLLGSVTGMNTQVGAGAGILGSSSRWRRNRDFWFCPK